MKVFAADAVFALVLASLPVAALAGEAAPEPAPKLPDRESAIAAAEKAALPMLGEQLLPEARPFSVSQHGDVWLVISRPALPPRQPGENRQALVIQLDRNTGEVLDIDTAR